MRPIATLYKIGYKKGRDKPGLFQELVVPCKQSGQLTIPMLQR